MADYRLSIKDVCSVEVGISVRWKSAHPMATVDTGFAREGLGLIVPRDFLPAKQRPEGVIRITVADGRTVAAPYEPVARITRIGGRDLPAPIETGAAFLGKGRILLGLDVLRLGVLRLNGPEREGTFTI